jgi:hypothetical protein
MFDEFELSAEEKAQQRERVNASIRSKVEQNGHVAMRVTDHEGKTPPYTYTIGGHTRNRPEVIITGRVPEIVAAALIVRLYDLWDSSDTLAVGRLDNFCDNPKGGQWPVMVVELDFRAVVASHANLIGELYPEHDRVIYQLIWCDSHGVFPHEEGYSVKPEFEQPLLPHAIPFTAEQSAVDWITHEDLREDA